MGKLTIGIWGQYGDGGKIADGQAVRTTIITTELENRYGKENVRIVNTNSWRRHPINFFLKSFKLVRDSRIVVIAPADNGYKVFVPLLMLFNVLFRRNLVHVVIGGFLPALLSIQKIYKWLENKFDAIFVQTENLRKDLEALGIRKIHILSNLKRLNSKRPEDLTLSTSSTIKVCTFSRVNKEKGVEDAVTAVRLVNEALGGNFVSLDIYGLVPDDYQNSLTELVDNNKQFVNYKGIIDYDKTVEVLSNYFVMLFPTFYYGEGFPGNVVDAYNSGLPIIATDWLYNKDVICNGRNGILVPIKSPDSVASAILDLYNDRELHLKMSQNCLADSAKYQPDQVLQDFYSYIDSTLV